MTNAEKIRYHIEEMNEEDVKRYLGDIVVKYVTREQTLVAEDEYIQSIISLWKLVAQEEIRRNSSANVELEVPNLK